MVALVLAALSSFEIATAVHTYCEDRWKVASLAMAAVIVFYFAVRSWPSGLVVRFFRALAASLCVLVVVGNVWFIVIATPSCRPLFSLGRLLENNVNVRPA
jgi:hypothetical protein